MFVWTCSARMGRYGNYWNNTFTANTKRRESFYKHSVWTNVQTLLNLAIGGEWLPPPPPKPHPLQFENGSNIVRQFSYSTLFFIIYIIRNMEYCLTVELFKTANRMLSMTCDHIGMYFFYINFSTGLCNNLFKLE